jgi:hypothetical protein
VEICLMEVAAAAVVTTAVVFITLMKVAELSFN